MPSKTPPRLPAALLRALLPTAERDEVLTDLAAEYHERLANQGPTRATLWYYRQTLVSVPSTLGRLWFRSRTGFEPNANAMQPGGPALEQWIMDARHAARRLRRRPLYAALATLTLALGIGGTAAVFGIVRRVLLDPLPYTDEKSIALFWSPFNWSQQEFAYLRGRIPGFSKVAQYTRADATLELGDAPARLVPGIAASSELFDILGARPALGRTFEPRDDIKGAEAVAVISWGLWQELGGDRSILGQRIRIGGAATTVIGVMPRGFWFPSPSERVWVPQQLDPDNTTGNYSLIGRVSHENSIDNMATPLAQLTALIGQRFHYTPQWDKTKNPSVTAVREAFVGPLRPTLIATFVAMGIILLISCANVAALMLGQVEGRTTELAVRSALGATRRRITGQLVAEALMLGVISGGVGALLAALSFRWLVRALALGAWAEAASLDWRVFGAAMAVAVAAALVISLAPTLSLWRGRLRGALGAGRTAGVDARGVRVESVLVVVEVALAVLMTAGAGLLMRSVDKLYSIDPGVETRGVGVVDVVLPNDIATDRRMLVMRDMREALRTVPGVKSAAVVQRPPLRGSAWSSYMAVEGKPNLARSATYVRLVSVGYLETMGIRVVKGRTFDESDMLHGPADTANGVVLINEALAKKYFDGEDPIGRRIATGFGVNTSRIVGVVRDVAEGSLTDPPSPARYVPYPYITFMASGQTLVFKVEGNGSPVALLSSVRAALSRVAPRVAVQEATTMDQVLATAVGPARQVMALVALLTTLALLLGAIGVYGVMSHFVARRRRDWGIRIALGLSPARVLSGVVGRSTALVATGIALGLGGFLLVARLLTSFIYGVTNTDPLALGAAVAALMLVGVAAALVPALRASRTDPATVLREQ